MILKVLNILKDQKYSDFYQTQEGDPIPTRTLISGESISESTLLRPRNIPKQMKKKRKKGN